jgi:hypothetical protein
MELSWQLIPSHDKNPTVMGWATRLSSVLVGSGVSYNMVRYKELKNKKKTDNEESLRRYYRNSHRFYKEKFLPITKKTERYIKKKVINYRRKRRESCCYVCSIMT